MRGVRFGMALWLLMAVTSSVLASVVYVDRAATGAANGATWTDAFTNLQAGVSASSFGYEVWAREGVYGPIAQKTNVAVYGGFSGTETTRGERDWRAHATVVNGNGGRGVTAAQYSTLDGFIITNTSGAGGAYYASRVNSTLENCRIAGNTSGDAVQMIQVGSTTGVGESLIRHCEFLGNHGTALFCNGRTNQGVVGPHRVTVDGCLFLGNSTTGTGGGIRTDHAASTLQIRNCIFSGNTAGNGGAMFFGYSQYTDGTPIGVSHCTFYGNQAGLGKTIFMSFEDVELDLNNSIIWGATNEQIRLQNDNPTLNMSYCDLEGGTGSIFVKFGSFNNLGGIFNALPGFVDADGGDNVAFTADDNFRLDPASPCVDAGTPSGVNHDFDGNLRPQSLGFDVGAFEISGALPRGLMLNVR